MIATHLDTPPRDPSFRARWNELAAGNPLRSWEWLSTWWKYYGESGEMSAHDDGRRLSLFVVHSGPSDDDLQNIAAILPCYSEHSLLRGRVLRLLGDGEVCTDHAGLLANDDDATEAAALIADHLAGRSDWDAVRFESIDEDDEATRNLFVALAARGIHAFNEPAQKWWAIPLPDTWDDFLARQSKSHRKQLRRAERRIAESNDYQWEPVQDSQRLGDAWEVLIDLHQRRRQCLGEPGCFSWQHWSAFHRDVAPQLLEAGRLRLSLLWDRETPLAAEYHLAGDKATYAYQGGVDPQRLNDEPGRLSLICTIKQAIAEGHSSFDLMRGDEPYKPHWRAAPHAAHHLLAVPPRALARLRNSARLGVLAAKTKAKRLAGIND